MEALECVNRAGSVPERDGPFRPCIPARLLVPREGRHVYKMRSAVSRPCARSWSRVPLCGLGQEVTMMLSNALGYRMDYKHPAEIMDEIAGLDTDLRRGLVREAGPPGQHPVARNDAGAAKARPPCMCTIRARARARFLVTEYVPTTERSTSRYPLILTTGPDIEPVQRRGADTAYAERDLARRGRVGNPSARRRGFAGSKRRRLG